MVEVFVTNVQHVYQADIVLNELRKYLPESKINFDLDDCDKILRIEAICITADHIRQLLKEKGFRCRLLE